MFTAVPRSYISTLTSEPFLVYPMREHHPSKSYKCIIGTPIKKSRRKLSGQLNKKNSTPRPCKTTQNNIKQEEIFRYINQVVCNKSLMTQSVIANITDAKQKLLNDIGKFSHHSSVAIANEVRVLHDKLKSGQSNNHELEQISSALIKSTDSMSRYFRNVNDALKYENGKFLANMQKCDLRHFLRIIANAYSLKYSCERHVVVQYSAKQYVTCDLFKIEQLFDNIFSSIFTRASNADVLIKAEDYQMKFMTESLDAIWISIKVYNNIEGWEEDLEDLLEDTISQVIIDSHHAKIWAHTSSQDTSFNIAFPLSSIASGEYYKAFNTRFFENRILQRLEDDMFSVAKILKQKEKSLIASKKLKDKARILFVDKDPSMQEYARLTLSQMGCRINISTSYLDILTTLKTNIEKYNILILDISFPNVDYELIYSIYQLCKTHEISIIFQVGDMNDSYKSILDKAGCHMILKPYSVDIMRSMILKIIT
jgi:CheY-like chemotaxis protein